MNTKIWATFDKSFDIGCRVVKWDESNGLNFIPNGNFTKKDISFEELSNKVKQFTVHWSVTYRAKDMFNGLNARKLSANILIDDNCDDEGFATIYQTMPINYFGWSQGSKFNTLGPGVEIAYMPQAWEKEMYSEANQKKYKVPSHETTIAHVHGTQMKVYLPTEAQLNSLYQLIWGFSELFPKVPTKFPTDSDGKYITTVLKDPGEYSGLLSHYHLTRDKIDTAGLDYALVEKEVALRRKFGF